MEPARPWTERERQILDLIARGCTNGEIAERLGITFATAKWHVSELITKLGVQSREDVAAYWARERTPVRRLSRAFAGFSLAMAAKVALGAAGIAGVAVAASVGASWAGGDGDGDGDEAAWVLDANNAVAQAATPTPTPDPDARPPSCPQPPFRADQPPLCRYTQYPELVALDRGGCDFSGIDLTLTASRPERYQWLDLSACDLTGADLTRAFGNGWSLAGSVLVGSTLDGGTFAEADFSGADLSGARISAVVAGADFTGTNLASATAFAIQPDTASWTGATCPDGTASDAHGATCLGYGVILVDPRSAWSRPGGDVCPPPPSVVQFGARCPARSFPALAPLLEGQDRCDLRGADLSSLHLESIDLSTCDLSGANLAGAALDGANLVNAILDGANLSDATLGYADLSGSSLRGSNMTGARLFRTEVVDVAIDETTTCPSGAPALAQSHGPCF